jgi:hypothetical protein
MSADHVKANADALELALAARRLELGRLEKDEERTRRGLALELIQQYTILLREPVPASPRRNPVLCCFKLVFPDGRWSVDEKQLAVAPREGRRRDRQLRQLAGRGSAGRRAPRSRAA